MLVEIPDDIVDEVKVLERLSCGRLWNFLGVEKQIEIARYHIWDIIMSAILKWSKKPLLPNKK